MNKSIITEYSENRKSLRKVGEEFGITKYQVELILRSESITIRGKSESQRGRKFSKEHREKLSIAHKGKSLSEEHRMNLCGKVNVNKGKGDIEFNCAVCDVLVSAKPYRLHRYCSKQCRSMAQGEAHFNYIGSSVRGEQTMRNWKSYIQFKKEVHSRDKKCLSCNSTSNFEVHHIEAWSKNISLRFDTNNGITLCKVCHRDLHKTCGQRKIDDVKHKKWLKEHCGIS